MDKNLLIAVALSIAVYAAWFGLVEKRVASPSPAAVSAGAGPQAAAPSAGTPPSGARQSAAAPASPGAAPTPQEREKILSEAEAVSIGNATARISPRGAAVVSWQYQEPLGVVDLIEDPEPGFFSTFPDLTFRRDAEAPGLVYRARRADGLDIVKEFVPGQGKVLPSIRITLTNASRKPLSTGPWTINVGPRLGTVASERKYNEKLTRALGLTLPSGGLAGKLETFKPGDHSGAYRWIGVDNRYFLAAFLPKPSDFPQIASAQPPEVVLTAADAKLAPGQSRAFDLPYYLGAKGDSWLAHYGVGLERSINYGFFSQLGRFTMKCLERIHSVVGNWGWSIVILTALIQIVLLPLTMKSLKAQAAMKRLQPEMAKLQQRYKSDPTKLNAEMMELYKKHGANPLGGCLPMLLQMPIFYALYYALRAAWELHNAPWIWWIHDLSAKDPYYILPLVMGGLMFAQAKLNPPTADPTQAQMMTWMPVIFTFMFLRFPSGLVLYWLTNSLANTVIQLSLRSRYNATR